MATSGGWPGCAEGNDTSSITTLREFLSQIKILHSNLTTLDETLSRSSRVKAALGEPEVVTPFASLTSPASASPTYTWSLNQAYSRLDILARQLSFPPTGTLITVREIRGSEKIIAFLDYLDTVQAELSRNVERELKNRGYDIDCQVDNALRANRSFGLLTVCSATAFVPVGLLGAANDQIGAAILLEIFAGAFYVLGLPDFARTLANWMGGSFRERARARIDNGLYYRATNFVKLLNEIRRRAEGPSVPGDFVYVADTIPLTHQLHVHLAGLFGGHSVHPPLIASTEMQYLSYPPPFNLSSGPEIAGPELATDFIYHIDHGEPVLLMVGRLASEPLPRRRDHGNVRRRNLESSKAALPGLVPGATR
ncbi:MAG: hypothetical protein AB7G93_20730 [Bdellovibrionales bacterium]